MGNQLSSASGHPSLQDNLVAELGPSVHYQKGLGNARFLKSIRASTSKEGLIVVKLFIKSDLSPPSLRSYADKLRDDRIRLQPIPNLLPYQKIIETEKAGYLIRQYMATSLYDRISTRPFLTVTEKKWLSVQLMNAMSMMHQRNVFHGDIKSENIMVTSWNWVYLADFAPFKPVLLPEDDPADFSYFFDTSQRRTCYIAPERFISTAAGTQAVQQLTPEMDIFSMGCVLAELFLDGTPLFTLSRLLRYKKGEYDPSTALSQIECPKIQELIKHMIQIDSTKRSSAEDYLKMDWYPAYFANSLHGFIADLSEHVPLSRYPVSALSETDIRIIRLYEDFGKLASSIDFPSHDSSTIPDTNGIFPMTVRLPGFLFSFHHSSPSQHDAALILMTLVSSCIRHLSCPAIKMKALDLILVLSAFIDDHQKLNRVVPLLLHLTSDTSTIIRCSALIALTQLLMTVMDVGIMDSDIFPEYIFSHIETMLNDSNVLCRVTYAQCLAHLSNAAMKFLDITQAKRESNEHDDDAMMPFYVSHDERLSEQTQSIQNQVIKLLMDPESIVKRALLPSVASLCDVFGRQKGNDILLSHMITYLNDKDWQLRSAFFEYIPEVGYYLGHQSVERYLWPLMVQSLHDAEEFVVMNVIKCMRGLLEKDMVGKYKVREFLRLVVPLCLHPNDWIRKNTIALISMILDGADVVDRYCLISPILRPLLQIPITQVDTALFRDFLKEPLSRRVYNQAILCIAKNKADVNRSFRTKSISFPKHDVGEESNFTMLLKTYEITAEDQEKIMLLLPFLSKTVSITPNSSSWEPSDIRRSSATGDVLVNTPTPRTVFINAPEHLESNSPQPTQTSMTSKLKMSHSTTSLASDTHSLASQTTSVTTQDPTSLTSPKISARETSHSTVRSGSILIRANSNRKAEASTTTVSNIVTATMNANHSTASLLSPTISKRPFTAKTTDRKIEKSAQQDPHLSNFLDHKIKKRFPPTFSEIGLRVNGPLPLPSRRVVLKGKQIQSLDSWRPSGLLVANYTEHKGPVNQIAVSPDHGFFVTASDDGTIKIWDSNRLEKNITFKSRGTYSHGDKVRCVSFCQNSHSVVSASDDGVIDVIRIEYAFTDNVPRYGKIQRIRSMKLEGERVISITHFNTEMESLLVYATNKGQVHGWDLRQSRLSWAIKIPSHYGCITSMVMDTDNHSWLVVGTSRGVFSCWDIRFQVMVRSWSYPSKSTIVKMLNFKKTSSEQGQSIISSAGKNEVSIWDITSGECKQLFCARPIDEKVGKFAKSFRAFEPPDRSVKLEDSFLANFEESNGCSLRGLACPDSGQYLITAGTDKKIRYWSFENIEKSFVFGEQPEKITEFSEYHSENLDIYYEKRQSNARPANTASTSSKPISSDDEFIQHSDSITDLALTEVPFPLLISSGRDGVVKVWK